ncbi:hypothetical protein L9G16_04185 [Shewanella sp. A25]|nr:hypothetical protein [Shewanella shenzhenensis]
MENSEQAQQLLRDIRRLLAAMNEAVCNGQWQRLRSLDLELCESIKLLENPDYAALKLQIQPLLMSQYRLFLGQLKQQQSGLSAKMQQHVEHQDGINSYFDVMKATR